MNDQYCRNCKTVESAGGDDNVKLCEVHSSQAERIAELSRSLTIADAAVIDGLGTIALLEGRIADLERDLHNLEAVTHAAVEAKQRQENAILKAALDVAEEALRGAHDCATLNYDTGECGGCHVTDTLAKLNELRGKK